MNSQLIKDSIAGVIRHLLQGVIVFLVAQGWITNSQGTELLMAAGVVGVMIIWSVINKYGLYTKITTALGMNAFTPQMIANGTAAVQLDKAVEANKA